MKMWSRKWRNVTFEYEYGYKNMKEWLYQGGGHLLELTWRWAIPVMSAFFSALTKNPLLLFGAFPAVFLDIRIEFNKRRGKR